MRYFRRLSPFSRVAGALGFLLILASLALASVSLVTSWMSYPHFSADSSRTELVALDLGLLGLVFFTVLNNHTVRRQLDRRPFPSDSWQGQIPIIMLLAAFPLCALTLAIFIPPTLSVYGVAFGASVLAAMVSLVGQFVLILSWRSSG